MKSDFKLLATQLKSDNLNAVEFINTVGMCKNIIDDMFKFNLHITRDAFEDDNPKTRAEFIKKYNIETMFHKYPEIYDKAAKIEYETIKNTFKLPGYDDDLYEKLNNYYEIGFKKTIENMNEKIEPPQKKYPDSQ